MLLLANITKRFKGDEIKMDQSVKRQQKIEPIVYPRQEDYPMGLEIPHIMGIVNCCQRVAYALVNKHEKSKKPGFPVKRIGRSGIRVPRDPFFDWWNSV